MLRKPRWRRWRGGQVYLTEERWQHIVEADNHPEMADYEDHLQTTIQQGRRRQEPLNPHKYCYVQRFDDLPAGFNHMVGIVLFGCDVNAQGETVPNNIIATAFLTHMRPSGPYYIGREATHSISSVRSRPCFACCP